MSITGDIGVVNDTPWKDLVKGLRLFKEHADLTIHCGQMTFRVHKVILCAQSDWFKEIYRTGCMMDKISSTITLAETEDEMPITHGDDPELISVMIDYFYGYTTITENSPMKLLKLCMLATKYTFNSMSLAYTARFTCAMLNPFISEAMLGSVVEYTYSNTPVIPIKKAIVLCAIDVHLAWLSTEAGCALMDNFPDFAKDIVQALNTNYTLSHKILGSISAQKRPMDAMSGPITAQPDEKKKAGPANTWGLPSAHVRLFGSRNSLSPSRSDSNASSGSVRPKSACLPRPAHAGVAPAKQGLSPALPGTPQAK